MKKIVLILSALVLSVGTMLADTTKKIVVENMHCKNCALNVEKILTAVEGVKSVDVNLETKEVTIDFDEQKTDTKKIIAAFEGTKYKVVDPEAKKCDKKEGECKKDCEKEKKDTTKTE